jgi:ribosomal protein S12 methylthiotransferase
MITLYKGRDTINVVTLGCSKNIVDSEFLMAQIKGNDVNVVFDSDTYEAKTVIINTCGFIRDAKQESVDTILRFIKAKEQGLVRQVFVTGCLSQRYRDDLEKEIIDVDKYLE